MLIPLLILPQKEDSFQKTSVLNIVFIAFLQISSEKEVFRREIVEMCEKLQTVEKTARQLELDNERLAFKVQIFDPAHVLLL